MDLSLATPDEIDSDSDTCFFNTRNLLNVPEVCMVSLTDLILPRVVAVSFADNWNTLFWNTSDWNTAVPKLTVSLIILEIRRILFLNDDTDIVSSINLNSLLVNDSDSADVSLSSMDLNMDRNLAIDSVFDIDSLVSLNISRNLTCPSEVCTLSSNTFSISLSLSLNADTETVSLASLTSVLNCADDSELLILSLITLISADVTSNTLA